MSAPLALPLTVPILDHYERPQRLLACIDILIVYFFLHDLFSILIHRFLIFNFSFLFFLSVFFG